MKSGNDDKKPVDTEVKKSGEQTPKPPSVVELRTLQENFSFDPEKAEKNK